MYYIAYAHKPCATLQSILLPSFFSHTACLATAHHSSISFLSLPSGSAQKDSSLQTIASVEVNARILCLKSAGHRLIVLTDHYNPKVLTLIHQPSSDGAEPAIVTESVFSLDHIVRAPAQLGLGLWIESQSHDATLPGHRVVVSHTHAGLLKIVPMLPSNKAKHNVSDTITQSNPSFKPNFSQAFDVRLPHPTLVSADFLQPVDVQSLPTMALLSLSCIPSRIPGLGEQCMPVLSFYSIDTATQQLVAVPWGPPRRPPPSNCVDPPASSSLSSKLNDSNKKFGFSATGSKRDQATVADREQQWAKSSLAHAHVPLATADALGAHLIHAIPARVGGGVVVFTENSILYVPPPLVQDRVASKRATCSAAASGTPIAQGKRRKNSSRSLTDQTTALDGSHQASSSTAASTPKSNQNGKRRRSSAATATSSSPPSTAESAISDNRIRLLRIALPMPVQVSAATTLQERDGTLVHPDPNHPSDCFIHVLFACNSGDLCLLRIFLEKSSMQPSRLAIQSVGKIPQPAGPNALCYLGESFVHVSSTTGDSVLYHIQANQVRNQLESCHSLSPPTSPSRPEFPRQVSCALLPSASTLVPIRSWDNLGPVVDFIVDDGAGGDPSISASAQARIVTCSGSGPTSSLRIVRNGVSLEHVADLAISSAHRVWTIHSGSDGNKATTLMILGYTTTCSVLQFESDGTLKDISGAMTTAGLAIIDSTVLTASSLSNNCPDMTEFVIVSDKQMALVRVSVQGQTLVQALWSPPVDQGATRISAAAVNQHGQVLLSLDNRQLIYFKVSDYNFIQLGATRLHDQVSCLDISPLEFGQQADYCVCGLWQSKTVQIFTIPDLSFVGQTGLSDQPLCALPRSIMLHRFHKVDKNGQPRAAADSDFASQATAPHLLIGLGDGNLVSYSLGLPLSDSLTKTVGVFDPKKVSFGSRALILDKVETSEGLVAVAVSGDRPSIVFSDSKKFTYSAIKYENVRSITTLFAPGQDALNLFVMADSVRIAAIGALQKKDIQTVPLGCHQPLAIVSKPTSRAIAVATWAFLPQGTASKLPGTRGSVKLFDHTDFTILDQAMLDPDERPNCITVFELNHEEIILVGTGFVKPDASETTSGRLLGFQVTNDFLPQSQQPERRLRLVLDREMRGNVYAVKSVQGRIAVAVNSEVKVFQAVEPSRNSCNKTGSSKVELVQTANWGCAFVASSLSFVEPNRLVVGDALRSMNVLEVDSVHGSITEIARDCDPFWTTAAELVDEESQTYIGADIAFNIYTTQRVKLGEEAKRRIQKAKDREIESGRKSTPSSNVAGIHQDGYAHVMQRQGVWHYGDMINKFQRGSLVAKTGSTVADPRVLFCTAAGAIGVIAHLDESVAKIVSQVERNIMQVIEMAQPSSSSSFVGQISFQEWRTLRTEHRIQAAAGFIDGEVVQMYLNGRLDREQKQMVLKGPRSKLEKVDADKETVDRIVQSLVQLC